MMKIWRPILFVTLLLLFLRLLGFNYIYDGKGSITILFLIIGISISMLLSKNRGYLFTFIVGWVGLGFVLSVSWIINNLTTPIGYQKIHDEGEWSEELPPYYVKISDAKGVYGLHDDPDSVRLTVYEKKIGPVYKLIKSFRTNGNGSNVTNMTPSQFEEYIEHVYDYETYGERRR